MTALNNNNNICAIDKTFVWRKCNLSLRQPDEKQNESFHHFQNICFVCNESKGGNQLGFGNKKNLIKFYHS